MRKTRIKICGWKAYSILFLLILAILMVRLTLLSAGHYQRGLHAEEENQPQQALRSYVLTIKQYYPFSPYSRKALQKGMSLSHEYRENQDRADEIRVLNEIRAALYAIRSFYQPYSDSLKSIEERLIQLQQSENHYGE